MHLWLWQAQAIKGFTVRLPCIASVVEQHPHRMCVGGSIPSAWVTEDMRMNGLKDYQPQTEALRNFSIDVSKKAVEKYALENFGRIPQSFIERDFARNCKVMEESRRIVK